jgi:hypothetical protein
VTEADWTCACGTIVPATGAFCYKCGTQKPSLVASGLTFDDFTRATESTPASREIRKASISSRIAVRFRYFFRRRSPRKRRLSPIGKFRRHPVLYSIGAILLITTGLTTSYSYNIVTYPKPVAKVLSGIELKAVKVLPYSDAYKSGFETGRGLLYFAAVMSHLGQVINSLDAKRAHLFDASKTELSYTQTIKQGELWFKLQLLSLKFVNNTENMRQFSRGYADAIYGKKLLPY